MDFSGLGVVTDLLNWMVANPWLGTTLLVVTGPFVMVCATGWLFESRVVPLWRGQSLSFFPGELILCVTMGAIVFGMGEVKLSSLGNSAAADFLSWWRANGAIVAVIFSSVLLWVMRKIYDAPVYNITPGATANSATKLAHDICGYLWYPFVICTLGVPVVVHAFATGDLICVIASVITVISFGCWFGLDALFDAKRKGWDLCAMHPDDTNTWYRRLLVKAQSWCGRKRGDNPHLYNRELFRVVGGAGTRLVLRNSMGDEYLGIKICNASKAFNDFAHRVSSNRRGRV